MPVLNRRSPYRNWRQDQSFGRNFTLNRASPQANGLVGWWPTLGVNGNFLADKARHHNSTAFDGDPSYVTRYPVGQAIDFDGNDRIRIADSADLGGFSAFSLSAWINIRGNTGGSSGGRIISKSNGGTGDDYGLFKNSANNFVFLRGNFPAFHGLSTTFQLTSNVWYLVTGTWDGATMRIYVNGALDNSSPEAGALGDTNNELSIGGHADSINRYFDGWIGDTRVCNRAPSNAEVFALWAPSTRWDLYKPPARAFFMGPTAFIRTPRYGFTNFQIPGIV